MNTIPNHFSLVTTIEQLFDIKSETEFRNQANKAKLMYWAEKIALLQMQLNGQSVLALLQSLLRNDFEPIQQIVVQLKTEASIDNQQLQKLEQDIATLYQQLGTVGIEQQIKPTTKQMVKEAKSVAKPNNRKSSTMPVVASSVSPVTEENSATGFLDRLFDD